MRILVILLAAGVMLGACKGKSKEYTFESDDGKSSVSINTDNAEEVADEMEKKQKELEKLPPLSMDEMKAMLPQELTGIKRTSFSANSMMGFASGEATYKKDDTSEIKLTIYDCAGEAGSSWYALSYWSKMTMESENENGYTKTIDLMGAKGVEDYKKYNNAYTLTYAANDRLLVTLQGQNIPLDQLKQAAKDLGLKAT